MSKKISVEDKLEQDPTPSRCQVDQSTKAALGGRKKPEPGQRNGETASSSPESGSLNGDMKRSGKSRRRRKRSSNPDKCPEEKVDMVKKEEKPVKQTSQACSQQDVLNGLQSECANVWFERSIYERAESLYQNWLTASFHKTSQSNPSPPSSGKRSNNAPAVAPVSSGPACHHGDRVACHHVKQAVWVNKTSFDQAERCFIEGSAPPAVPNSLVLLSSPNCPAASRTPDEGYQSQAQTPATPVIQQGASTPVARQSINGLPRIPLELVKGVWLDKPLYDRAEAAFYQNMYGNNCSKRPSCTSTSRCNDHPQSLVEEEEEEEEEVEELVEEKPLVLLGKAEVFHALHPIQEEEEPAEASEKEETPGIYFLHPDSERVWLDKGRWDAAESRFHGTRAAKACAAKKDRRAEAKVASKGSQRDKKMTSVDFLAKEKIWFDKPRYDEAEKRFYEHKNGGAVQTTPDVGANAILQDIARARENIQKSLAGLKTSLCSRGSAQPSLNHQSLLNAGSNNPADQGEIISRINSLELENKSLHKVVEDLRAALSRLECRVAVLEKPPASVTAAPPRSCTNGSAVQQKSSAPAKEDEEDDDDIDLFGSDDDEEADKLKEQRLKEYAEKKAKKPAIIAKSSILLDVKP
ncbi:hypothetical protein OJAV_G00033590 [Oryzias javanicus]|uniref:Elongation factor 1 beta central acidic region eukaryote domain-containing protein n=1 Tax=Oryzias javanicus TaxID=123683 RepID=A0A3S2ME02_ORYJA|nr:hypothetical protein OJAV_G00033590 [Oryzias javanicus]